MRLQKLLFATALTIANRQPPAGPPHHSARADRWPAHRMEVQRILMPSTHRTESHKPEDSITESIGD